MNQTQILKDKYKNYNLKKNSKMCLCINNKNLYQSYKFHMIILQKKIKKIKIY